MQKGILLSDHELLNDLYNFNLRAFCSIDLTICSTMDEAINALKVFGADCSIVICLSQINNEDCPVQLRTWFQKHSQSTPLVVIGQMSKLSNTKKVLTLPPNLNIPLVVKSCANVLGVTAKDMAAKEIPDFYPIPISMLRNFEQAPCDIYIKVGKSGPYEFSQTLAKGEALQPNVKFDAYCDDGVSNLYIPSAIRLSIVNEASRIVMDKLDDPTLANQDKVATVEQGFEVIGGLLGEDPRVTPEIVAISKKCMEAVSEILKSVPRLKNLLSMMLKNKTGYIYLHSVMGTYVSHHIVKNISWGSDEQAEKLHFVFYFHDIFLAPIFAKYPHLKSEENLVFQEDISESDKEIVINHARLASEMVKNFPHCPMGANAIISQHHGTSNGMGFALEYKDDISPLSKVLIVSEAFVDEIIQARDDNEKINVDEIIERLRIKFTKHTYKKIILALENIRI